jgi:uncharacterized protein (UPF0147 family)
MELRGTFLNEIFLDQYPKDNKMPRNLRNNAREAATYLTGIPYQSDPDAMKPIGRAGRSSGSNN